MADVVHELGSHPRRQWRLQTQLRGISGIDVLRQAVNLRLREAECLSDVPQYRPRPVGDDVRHHGRSFPPVAPVAVLNHLLAPIGFEIEIDVRRPAALLGEEAFEGKPEPDWIDPGQAQAPAHRRVGSRAANLTEDVLLSGELDDVPHHQEVPGEVELPDHRQFVLQPLNSARIDAARPIGVHLAGTFIGQMAEILHLGSEMTGHGEVGELRGDQVQIERQHLSQSNRTLDGAGIAGKPRRHLVGMFQVSLIGCTTEPVVRVQRTASGDGGGDVGQVYVAAIVVVNVVGRHDG